MQAELFSGKVPPQDLEAEQSVLGACLIDREALVKVQGMLRQQDFYAERHGEIWRAIQEAASKGPADLITVQDRLKQAGLEIEGGWLPYLTSLINLVPTTANVERHAEIVGAKARLRRLQESARRIVEACYEAEDPSQILGDLQKAVDEEGRTAPKRGLKPVGDRIGSYAEERYKNRHLPNADWIPSRFPDVREKCPYLRREVTLLAAPPNTGKTTMGIAEAYFLASLGYRVAFFELEQADQQVYDKLIAQAARLDVRAIRMNALTEPEWFQYRQEGQRLNELLNTLSLNTETAETMSNIRWQCLRLKAEAGLDMVIIDFLDRISETRDKDERYDQLVARIAGIGQAIARECNCHVMILAQIDVQVYKRANPIPTLSDLANSKTNLGSWPDNVITAIQPKRAVGDGKSKPKIYGVECKDKRWTNVLLLSVAKGRFSEGGAVIPVYSEMRTGYLGALQRPWPWQDSCPEDSVGTWDKEADDEHLVAMRKFREQATAVQAETIDDF